MIVFINMTDWFKRFISGAAEIVLEMEQGTTAIDAVIKAGIPAEEVGFITVNNVRVNETQMLCDGDRLKVYPVIIGG